MGAHKINNVGSDDPEGGGVFRNRVALREC